MPECVGEHLVRTGKLATEQLDRVRQIQIEKGGLMGPLLVQLGFVSERDLADSVAELTGWTTVDTKGYGEDPGLNGVSSDFLRQHHAVPLAANDEGIGIALADPGDGYVVRALELALGRSLVPRVGLISDIQTALNERYPVDDAESEETDGRVADDRVEDIAHLRDMASEAPVIRRVNQLIARALELRASDIHIEPQERSIIIRYRVDGVLRTADFPRDVSPAAIVSRIKVMADLNIAERRLPQDGRIKIRMGGRQIDMRLSTVPTLHGESIVMRLLDRSDVALDLAALGFDDVALRQLHQILARPQGIILVTGPTGSGKTTTLYAALSLLNSPDRKILTVEDPVEYQLQGINQIPIRPNIDLTFARALRAILRQDPDVVMVGEMRDIETAKIAVQAALTGHKVFSTLHTNDAASSITRLQDMQVDDYLLVSTIDAILAQRLVRRLCPHCREAYSPDPALIEQLGRDPTTSPPLYRARGCEACDDTGYHGRITIAELMLMSDAIRGAVLAGGDAAALKRVARDDGMTDMHTDGLNKAFAGLTTLEEVERVVQSADETA